ncbi:zinc ribbon domain-containing protein [Paenibacillus sp. GCM10027627]|uniref:zinc ribbon domain-containing protein n=1 Tax=unclassified Paenibacillus TaxID=185978 RepID=UPI00362CD181
MELTVLLKGTPPLNAWIDIGATTLVLLLAGALLGAMFLFIKISTDDSDKHKILKEMVEALFNTPAHLRSGQDTSGSGNSEDPVSPGALEFNGKTSSPAFVEPCPACGHEVNERDNVCPSCELRLL